MSHHISSNKNEEHEKRDENGSYDYEQDIDVRPTYLLSQEGGSDTKDCMHSKERNECDVEVYTMGDICKPSGEKGEMSCCPVSCDKHDYCDQEKNIRNDTVYSDENPVEFHPYSHRSSFLPKNVRPHCEESQPNLAKAYLMLKSGNCIK